MGMLVTTCNIVYNILKVLMVNECMQLCTRNACDGRACACVGTTFEKAHARMKRIYITCNGKYTENCWAETETSQKELTSLH